MSLKTEIEEYDFFGPIFTLTVTHNGKIVHTSSASDRLSLLSEESDILNLYNLGVQDGKEAVSNGLLGHGRLPRSAEDRP